jgi:Anti-sigma factor NepR
MVLRLLAKTPQRKKSSEINFRGGTSGHVSALARNGNAWAVSAACVNMGERGKKEMKHRNSNLEPVEPVSEKLEGRDDMARPTSPKPEARLGREVQARIGQQLRAIYNDVVNQGVPPHLADLVRRLSDQDQD